MNIPCLRIPCLFLNTKIIKEKITEHFTLYISIIWKKLNQISKLSNNFEKYLSMKIGIFSNPYGLKISCGILLAVFYQNHMVSQGNEGYLKPMKKKWKFNGSEYSKCTTMNNEHFFQTLNIIFSFCGEHCNK